MRVNANGRMRNDGIDEQGAASDRGAPGRSAWLLAAFTPGLFFLSTPPRRITRSVVRDGGGGEARLRDLKIGCTSRRTSNFCRWGRSIRENIIGHRMRRGACYGTGRGMATCREQISARGAFGSAGRAFALLDKASARP